jgi:hypothetical protein
LTDVLPDKRSSRFIHNILPKSGLIDVFDHPMDEAFLFKIEGLLITLDIVYENGKFADMIMAKFNGRCGFTSGSIPTRMATELSKLATPSFCPKPSLYQVDS